jgi:hypothetical protein
MLGGEAWIVAIVSRIQELRPGQESKEQEDRARFKQVVRSDFQVIPQNFAVKDKVV